MQKIALITDSSCDLTHETLKKYDITMFPIRIIYKDREYLDKITISAEEMYASLKEEIPSTSLPDLHYCENQLTNLKAAGYTHFIIITVASALSGTHNAIRLMMEAQDMPFYVFDSCTLGFPVGTIAIEAAKLLQKGASFDETIAALPDIRKRTHGYITVETLEYLKRGGRISAAAATIGDLIKLRPIIAYDDKGLLYTYGKARGNKQSLSKMAEIITSFLDKQKCIVYILQGDAYEQGLALFDKVKDHANISHISLETIGPSMGIHTGPGVFGFSLLTEQ